MRRQLGTVVSVVSLLAIAASAAAVNVRVLQGSGSSSLVLTKAGDMTLMDATVQGSESARPSAMVSASAAPRASADAAPSTNPAPNPTASASPDGPVPIDPPPSGGSQSPDGSGRDHRAGVPPQPLTRAQLDVLRIALLAHVPPEVVIAVAKGNPSVPEEIVQMVQSRAAYANIDLTDLSDVADVPRLRDRGHGGPNAQGGTNSDS